MIISAINTSINQQTKTQNAMTNSLLKIATGSKSGDGSSYNGAIEAQRTRLSSFAQAATNTNIAISIAQSQYDAMKMQLNILGDIRAKLVELNNATLTASEESALGTAINDLATSFDNIAADTRYGEKFLLQSNAGGGGASASDTIQVGVSSNSTNDTFGVESNTNAYGIGALKNTVNSQGAQRALGDVDTAIGSLNANILQASSKVQDLKNNLDVISDAEANAKSAVANGDGVDYASEKETYDQLNLINQGAVFAVLRGHEFQKNVMKLLDPQYA